MFANQHICVVLQSSECHIGDWNYPKLVYKIQICLNPSFWCHMKFYVIALIVLMTLLMNEFTNVVIPTYF